MAYSFSDHFYVTQLSSGITSSATTIQVDTLTAEFADEVQAEGEFPLRIGRGQAQERVLVTGIADEAAGKLTVERGVEYGASSHNAGARVAHAMPAETVTRIDALSDALHIQEDQDVEHLYLPEDGKMWQDSGQTTPVDVNNLPQPLGALEDQSGNHVATQPTTANKPSVKKDANGNLYIEMVANEDYLETTVSTPKATKVSTIPGVGAFSAEVDPSLKSRSNVRIQSTTAGALVRTGTYSQDARGDWASALDQRGKNVADQVTSFENYFREEPLLHYDAHAQDTSSVTNTAVMFFKTGVSDLSSLSNWDTSSVTDMRNMFRGTSVSDLSSLSNWDTSSVTDMRFMFFNTGVSDLSPLSNWDTSSVTNMRHMFRATSVSDLSPLSNWDTSSVTRMDNMFRATSVSDPSTISGWDVANVSNFSRFLEGAPLDDVPTGNMLDGWTDGSPNTASDMESGVLLGIQNADYSNMDSGGQDAVDALCSDPPNWTINATNAPADCS